jgi:hypothetical protein
MVGGGGRHFFPGLPPGIPPRASKPAAKLLIAMARPPDHFPACSSYSRCGWNNDLAHHVSSESHLGPVLKRLHSSLEFGADIPQRIAENRTIVATLHKSFLNLSAQCR